MAKVRRDLGDAAPPEGFKPLLARNDVEVHQLPESPLPHPVLAIEWDAERCVAPRERLHERLRRPLGSGISREVEMEWASPLVCQDDQDI